MRRELVLAALQHADPSRMPLVYFNGDKSKSDLLLVEVVDHHLAYGDATISEWGFVWEAMDGTMGQVTTPVIPEIEAIPDYRSPKPEELSRYANLKRDVQRFGSDRYYVASLGLSGFTIMTLLLGFERVLEMLALEDRRLDTLADTVFGFEETVIEYLPRYGFDGIAFFDDWGTQNNLIISPNLWRRYFLPRYRKQFTLAHNLGLTVYFHSCGYIEPIIEDLIGAGVDFLNISQPNLYDLSLLGKKYGERVCFIAPISYQTTSIAGTEGEIWNEVERIISDLGAHGKAVIGYLEEYESIGLSKSNYDVCERAFQQLGNYSAHTNSAVYETICDCRSAR